jgi:hypothetical protein
VTPLVTFRCVVDGCGSSIAGLFPPLSGWGDPDVPVLGIHYGTSGFTARNPGHPQLPEPEGPWWPLWLPLDRAVGLGIRCRIHGVWFPTAKELQEYWDVARRTNPTVIRLGPDRLRPVETVG